MTTPTELYETHRELLDRAIRATTERDYWSAFPESPSKSVYGEQAAAVGVDSKIVLHIEATHSSPGCFVPGVDRGRWYWSKRRGKRVRGSLNCALFPDPRSLLTQ